MATLFDTYIGFNPSKHYNNIINYLNTKNMQLEILVVIESGMVFDPFLQIFQKSDPMIHVLYCEIINLSGLLVQKYVKKTKSMKKYFEESNMISLSDIQLSTEIKNL